MSSGVIGIGVLVLAAAVVAWIVYYRNVDKQK